MPFGQLVGGDRRKEVDSGAELDGEVLFLQEVGVELELAGAHLTRILLDAVSSDDQSDVGKRHSLEGGQREPRYGLRELPVVGAEADEVVPAASGHADRNQRVR